MSRRPKRNIQIDSSNNQQQKIRVEMEWSSETRSQLTETSTRDQDLLDQLDCGKISISRKNKKKSRNYYNDAMRDDFTKNLKETRKKFLA